MFCLLLQIIEPEERNSSRQGGEDVQILRLDDETRREETYRRVGGSEILTLDHENNVGTPDRVDNKEVGNPNLIYKENGNSEQERSKSLQERGVGSDSPK